MRVLIVTAGSHGDVNPFIAIGRALRSRGHDAILLTNPYYKSQVEEAGIAFEPMGEFQDLTKIGEQYPDIMHPTRGGRIVLDALLVPAARDAYIRLLELAPVLNPSVVLHHIVCPSVPWACERLGLPCATAVLSPINWLARGDTLAPFSWSPENPHPLYSAAMRGMFNLLKPFASRLLDRPFNEMRHELGLRRGSNLLFGVMQGGGMNLGLWSPVFRGPCEGDPANSIICGFCRHDRHGDAERDGGTLIEELEDFIAEGEPPILFCLGTAAVHVAGDFYEHAAEACRMLNRRGLLLVGPKRVAPGNLPRGTRAFAYAPFSRVMPRCAVNVHHGGVGSTGQALLAGRPMVVIPHAHDQFDNAARVRRLGVSATLCRPRVTARRLADAVSRIETGSDAKAKASSIARAMAAENGSMTVVDTLDRLVHR